MFSLFALFIISLGAVTAIELGHSPLLYKPALVKAVEVEGPVAYEFAYSVHDEHTGDIKSQSESRKGDQVKGQYALIDPDGYLRIVEYTSDAHNGFNAIVKREPLGHKAPVGKVLSPIDVGPKLLGLKFK